MRCPLEEAPAHPNPMTTKKLHQVACVYPKGSEGKRSVPFFLYKYPTLHFRRWHAVTHCGCVCLSESVYVQHIVACTCGCKMQLLLGVAEFSMFKPASPFFLSFLITPLPLHFIRYFTLKYIEGAREILLCALLHELASEKTHHDHVPSASPILCPTPSPPPLHT